MNPPDILLVLPCYRDGARLALYLPGLCGLLHAQLPGVAVQVVDDGSPSEEQTSLAAFVDKLRPRYDFLRPVILCRTNCGKGLAIRTGWGPAPDVLHLAFVDSDGAVPAGEVVALLARARASTTPVLLIADRTQSDSVKRFWYRHLGSRLYNRWVRLWLGLDLPDTQCGLKAVPAAFYRQHEWLEERFAFDLELLLVARAAGLRVVRQPIAWTEKPDSRLGLIAIGSLFVDAVRLRHRAKAGAAGTIS